MRTLKYAILGLLMRKPMTGYELAKEFNFELSEFWYANHSQIYPELKKLYNEGFVTFDVEINGDILESKRYNITDEGHDDFISWLQIDDKIEKTPKNIFRLRMYFSNELNLDKRIQLLENQRMQHLKKLSVLSKKNELYKEVPAYDSERFGDFIVLKSALMREQNVINWINECIGYCKVNV